MTLLLTYSGPPDRTAELIDALIDAGHPARLDPARGGFPPEPDTDWVEVLAADEPAVSALADLAGFRHRCTAQILATTVGFDWALTGGAR